MDTTRPTSTGHDRFRRFIVWFVMLVGAFSTMLLSSIVLFAYVFDGNLAVYINKFGEARVELVVFAIVMGLVPFGLYLFDDLMRQMTP